MANKIICRTPSTGRPINILVSDIPNKFITIAEPSYYSVSDPSERYDVRDPDYSDNSRGLREGEIFFVTPLSVRNKSDENHEVEVRIVTETEYKPGVDELSKIVQFSKIVVPPGDTALIPLQGRSLFKREIAQKIKPASIGNPLEDRESAITIKNNINTIVDNVWSNYESYTNIEPADEELTKRDTELLLNAIVSALSSGVDRPVLDFIRALFKVDNGIVTCHIASDKIQGIKESWDYIETLLGALSLSTQADTKVSEIIAGAKATLDVSFTENDLEITDGDLLQIKAETADVFDIWISGEEKPANEHTGVENISFYNIDE